MDNIDLSHLIDRLESMEDSAGASLNAMSAFLPQSNRANLIIAGEVIFTKPVEKSRELRIKIVVYDPEGRVMDTYSEDIGTAGVPFDAFSLKLHDIDHVNLSKIRVYPIRRIISEYGFDD